VSCIIVSEKRRKGEKEMTKEMMMDAVINRFGFESKWTIWFFECAEVLTMFQLENAYMAVMTMTCEEEEEA
jgi:hypothetical protein